MILLTNSSAAPFDMVSMTSANDEGWVSVGGSADTASFAGRGDLGDGGARWGSNVFLVLKGSSSPPTLEGLTATG